ncbi:hypothetical protein G6F37_012652 [Rhizopus arrhizus]|nr:hypothetical protein G6F38_013294 [Rhizopus arrhizus]KAG1142368.1 hypothetical protein G6F37_012652 [Rhizopus arrhizus]
MDTEMPEEDNSKPDSTSVAEDKDDFQEAISTLDSVDEGKIDGSNLPIQIDEDSSQKKTGRKEATKRLLYPLVTFNSLSMNIHKQPFLPSILNNEIIDGYCLKARRSNPDLQLTAAGPVKLLAYADDILIFINSKEEFLELQECLKVYNGESNSQVNYSKSVAFPLAGRSAFNNRELKELISHNGLRWFDSQSLGYIKYLGYPI